MPLHTITTENVFCLKQMAIEEIKQNRAIKRKDEVLCVLTINLFIMKLVLQIDNKIERHFRSLFMTPFLSSMHSNCYIYLSYVNLQPTIFDGLGVLNLKMN